MLSRRIIGASAVLLAVAIGSAAAQEQTSAGKPLQLLQFARHQAKAPLHPRARAVAKLAKHAEVKRHVANKVVAKHRKMFAAIHAHAVHPHRMAEAAPAPEPAQPTPAAPPPATVWPAVNAAAPAAVAMPAPPAAVTMPAPPAAPQNVTTEQVLSDAPNDIAANGQVAQTAAAPEPNVPDAAADQHAAAAQAPAPAQSAAPEPVVRAMVATPAPAESNAQSPVGGASWMMQVLAALGGAVAAGVVARFLILRRRPEPENVELFSATLVPGE
jgi:pilus assembly protein FimV